MSQRVVFSHDFDGDLREALEELDSERVLLITTASRRYVDRVVPILGAHEIFDGAIVHVPAEVVAKADAVVQRFRPDTLIALGGGATTGLAKALQLNHELSFVAIPTTYSGSERTTIYGITSGDDKQTGRDDRVRPDVVIYEASFTAGMPLKLTVQSLMNALAHPVSALSAGVEGEDRESALGAIRLTANALRELIEDPSSLDARRDALRATAAAGDVIQRGKLGVHHRLAHFLGGRFNLPHAPVHSLLLPHSLAALDDTLHAAIDVDAPLLLDFLEHAGAEISLRELGVDEAAFEAALADQTDLPKDTLRAAFRGELGDFT